LELKYTMTNSDRTGLPEFLRSLFWDVDFNRLNWDAHREYIAGRILESGNWNAIRWLRTTWGDDALRAYLLSRKGRGLSPPQLRYWQVVLNLPSDEVDVWIARLKTGIWEKRISG